MWEFSEEQKDLVFFPERNTVENHISIGTVQKKEKGGIEGYWHNFPQLCSIPTVPSCQMELSLCCEIDHYTRSRHPYNLLNLQTWAHLYAEKSTASIAPAPKKLPNNFLPQPPPSNEPCVRVTQNYQQALYPQGGKEDRQDERVHGVLTLSSWGTQVLFFN